MELPAAQPLFRPERPVEVEEGFRIPIKHPVLYGLILLSVLVGFGAFLGVRTLIRRLATPPPQVLAAEESVIRLLRRGDGRSRQEAITIVEQLSSAKENSVSARSLRLLTLSLELGQLKYSMRYLQARSEELGRQIARLQQLRTPIDWETRANMAQAQNDAVKAQARLLAERASAMERQVSQAFSALRSGQGKLPAAEELAALRAEAVFDAVNGSQQALALAERYRLLGGADGWDAIAFAEYATNARVAPETLTEARIGIERVRATDSAFILAYLLGARLALAQRDLEAAGNWLDAVIALHPSHDSAKQLLSWIEDAKRSASPKVSESPASER